jgi:hypothetical protein
MRHALRNRASGDPIPFSMVQLPGLNTPQFTWGRTKLAKQTQPVPPIYQPEVAAEAIHWCATHRRRELYVGLPTACTILGEKLAPWLVDRYLAKTAYSSQKTDERLDPRDHDNLFEPVDEDRGAHGPFDGRAHRRSLQLWLATRRRSVAAGTAGLAALAGAAVAPS